MKAKANDRAVFLVETFAPLMTLRELQTFLAPEPLDLIVIHHSALEPKQLGDFAIAIWAILFGKPVRVRRSASSSSTLRACYRCIERAMPTVLQMRDSEEQSFRRK